MRRLIEGGALSSKYGNRRLIQLAAAEFPQEDLIPLLLPSKRSAKNLLF